MPRANDKPTAVLATRPDGAPARAPPRCARLPFLTSSFRLATYHLTVYGAVLTSPGETQKDDGDPAPFPLHMRRRAASPSLPLSPMSRLHHTRRGIAEMVAMPTWVVEHADAVSRGLHALAHSRKGSSHNFWLFSISDSLRPS